MRILILMLDNKQGYSIDVSVSRYDLSDILRQQLPRQRRWTDLHKSYS